MQTSRGGGQKVNILIKELRKIQNDSKTILLFTDSYDVVATQDPSYVLTTFKKFKANVVFSAESNCWPDSSLQVNFSFSNNLF